MSLERYNRQILLEFIGEEGQRRIGASTVVVAGCGALGSTAANVLARAGVGCLRIVDRDFVEEVNLQRQMLFDEQDVRECLPKAVAAERKLRQINSTIRTEGQVADINPSNVEKLIAGATVVVDGTDNFETRFLINDACVKHAIPWIYGGAVGATGMSLTVVPGRTPCLRCVFEGAPPPGSAPTCETAGILSGAAGIIGNFQATEALKICAGRVDGVSSKLFSVDLWTGEARHFNVERARESADCVCCKQRRFEFLDADAAAGATVLCGRSAVQVRPPGAARVDLAALAKGLAATAGVEGILCNEYLLRFSAPTGGAGGRRLETTVFADGRAIVKGTRELAAARAAYAKYVGM
jgi:adenylyltransferase/sulfurtransferase